MLVFNIRDCDCHGDCPAPQNLPIQYGNAVHVARYVISTNACVDADVELDVFLRHNGTTKGEIS